MFHSIDMKSVLIGGFVVALILCLFGAVHYVPPEDHGRFKIEANDDNAFILDSATGQVWAAMFPYSQSIGAGLPDPNFYAPKTYQHSTTDP